MTDARTILWHGPHDHSTELCHLTRTDAGWSIQGTVLLPAEGEPARCEYRVDTGPEWTTRTVEISLTGVSFERHLRLAAETGRWSVDGDHDSSLDGCSDVDLRVTPATNTLPIRRHRADVGAEFTVSAAWVGLPDLRVVPSEQHYERLSETTYRYRAGSFTADLVVDADGRVVHYGDDYWRALART